MPRAKSSHSFGFSLLALGLSLGLCASLASTTAGCAFVQEDLRRAEESYEQARYERARAWLIDLESDIPGEDLRLRIRYYYLRGMTEHRLRHRAEARHYLAVARELAGEEEVGLDEEQRELMTRALADLTAFPDERTSGGDASGSASDQQGQPQADDGGQAQAGAHDAAEAPAP